MAEGRVCETKLNSNCKCECWTWT